MNIANAETRSASHRSPATSFTVVDLRSECFEGVATSLNVIRGMKEVPREANGSEKATPSQSRFPRERSRLVTTI
jgi:hypothetical protein